MTEKKWHICFQGASDPRSNLTQKLKKIWHSFLYPLGSLYQLPAHQSHMYSQMLVGRLPPDPDRQNFFPTSRETGKHQGVHVTFLPWALGQWLKWWRHVNTQVPWPPTQNSSAVCLTLSPQLSCKTESNHPTPVRFPGYLTLASPSFIPHLLLHPATGFFQEHFPTNLFHMNSISGRAYRDR